MNASEYALETAASRRPGALVTILRIGLVAGTLDITDNLIFNSLRGISPAMVFRYIASGLIGTSAARRGVAPILLGVLLHYSIALIWTGVFYAASRKLTVMLRRAIVCGLIYGAMVYLFMNLVVVPLSSVPRVRSVITPANRINGALAVVLLIGLMISLLVRRSSTRNPAAGMSVFR